MNAERLLSIVDEFLTLCEARDALGATKHLSENSIIEFPGSRVYRSLQELFDASKGQYQWVRKTRTRTMVSIEDDAGYVVTMGTLSGCDAEGNEFEGVRFLDSFVLRDDLICEQRVWNDLCMAGVGG